jgi:hypothetical protein
MDTINQRIAAWIADCEDPSLLIESYNNGMADPKVEADKALLHDAYQILTEILKGDRHGKI